MNTANPSPSATADSSRDDFDRRLDQQVSAGHPDYWNRFDARPDLAGKRALEIGCGSGALSIEMALRNAGRVVGVDIRSEDVRAASAYVRRRHPELVNRLEFTDRPLSELEAAAFDLVVSKDSFEHIIDVPGVLAETRRVLAPGGRVYIGFSPLYHSPYGDHDRRRTAFRSWGLPGTLLAALPWGHLVLERKILERHRVIQNRAIDSMHDLNLNQMSVGEFRQRVADAGFEAEYFAVNRGNNPIGKLLSAFRRLPGLEKYCTYNVYCVLRPA